MKNSFIVSPFNGPFFVILGLHLAFALVLIFLFRSKPEKTRRKLVGWLYVFVFVAFIVYKLLLPLDAEYMAVYDSTWGGFTYLNELPLNPCNITLMLVPLAMLTMKRSLLSFCFYAATFGPLMSLVVPITGFDGYSLFSIHMIGYYFTHVMLFMVPLLLVALRLYTPKARDVLSFAKILLLLGFIVFLIDIFLRRSGLCPAANYFFCFEDEGNPVLILFHKIIPIPFLCVVPGLLLSLPAGLVLTGIYRGAMKLLGVHDVEQPLLF